MPLKQLAPTGNDFPMGTPDVQRTSFSVDVMGRFICNTFAEATANPNFDVVVIGSGMYGAYAAAKLYRDSRSPEARRAGTKPLRILVLEAGPFLVHEHSQNIPELNLSNPFRGGSPENPEHLVWGQGWRGDTYFPGTAYCVGGKSLYWGGWCPRLRDSDLAQWPAEVRDYLLNPPKHPSNFPNRLSSPTQNSVYEEVEFEIGVKPPDDFVFDPVGGNNQPPNAIGLNAAFRSRLLSALAELRKNGSTPLQDPEPPPIAVQTQSFVSGVFSPDKFSSLGLLISALRARPEGEKTDQSRGIFLVPNAHVSRLVIPDLQKDGATSGGYRVTSIQLVENEKPETLNIPPQCTVVLALGCIESTRLALESFPTAAVRGGDEIMGRNLMAHLRFDFPFSIDRLAFRNWVNANIGGKVLDSNLQTASFHLQADTTAGRFHLQVYATGETIGSDGEGLFYKMIPDAELAQQLADGQDPAKIKVIFRACGEMSADRTAKVHQPGTSWIDLAKSPADQDQRFGHARAFVHYENQDAAPIWKNMRDACTALAQAIGAQSIPAEDRHGVGTTWHDSGTLFMGSDPIASVTDVNGHFHHVANAMCVDQALFPTVGSANPVLTGLCLSRKASESVIERFTSEPELGAGEIAAEKSAGFEFLLDPANSGKWKPNNPAFVDTDHPLLIENRTILQVHGDKGLGVAWYDDPALFGDFELRLQWKAFFEDGTGEITANSGVFLRCPLPSATLTDANFYDQATEIQIDDTGYDFANRRFRSPLHRTGAIYKVAPARARVQKIPATRNTLGFWNNYRITAIGTKISVELNGALVSEGDVTTALAAPGRLALQYHSGLVQFRSIRVRRL